MKTLRLALVLCAFLSLGGARAQLAGGLMFPGPGNPATSGAWTPASLPGLVAWYKADVGVYTDTGCTTAATNTQTVACWKDQSGNNYNLIQSISGNRPQFLSAGLNSKQTVQFTAANATGMITATGVAFGATPAAAAFWIGSATSSITTFAVGPSYCAPTGACNSTGGLLNFTNGTASALGAQFNSSSSGFNTFSFSTETRFGVQSDATNVLAYINNSPGSTAVAVSGTTTTAGCIGIGEFSTACVLSTSTTANGWDGPISEIIITNQAISSGNLALLDAYLVSRW